MSNRSANRDNLYQLIQLRWIAVVGQILAIGVVQLLLEVDLPLLPMACVIALLIVVNLGCLVRLRLPRRLRPGELFAVLLIDVLALTGQLYLSGGVTNPFVSLFLLQVTLAAVLLPIRWAFTVVGVTACCVVGLWLLHEPLALPPDLADDPFGLHLQGFMICFLLDALLLVVFVTRISGNLRARDAHLANLRRQAVEEEHIVRMGLLASGAAHELGTPLATLSVILGDWQHMPAVAASPELSQEIGEMQVAINRCKRIISGILLSAGEARGEDATGTTIRAFLEGFSRDWYATLPAARLEVVDDTVAGMQIVADPMLQQALHNLVANAQEAGSARILLAARREEDNLLFSVSDEGHGFPPDMLDQLGQPYRSTKEREGRGLGLFLVVNVVRKLGGRVTAANRPRGGATVTISLPLATIAIQQESADV